jgi:hypothetical protein
VLASVSAVAVRESVEEPEASAAVASASEFAALSAVPDWSFEFSAAPLVMVAAASASPLSAGTMLVYSESASAWCVGTTLISPESVSALVVGTTSILLELESASAWCVGTTLISPESVSVLVAGTLPLLVVSARPLFFLME